jgi:hypothetical protein
MAAPDDADGMRPAPCPAVPGPRVPDVPIGDRTGTPNKGAPPVKHSSTQSLYTYWNERRGARPAPDRAEIEPGAIRTALGDSFILGSEPATTFRLAGTRVCSLFGRELKGEPFAALWNPQDAGAASDLLAIVANEIAGIVAGVTATTAEGYTADLELLLLPLRHRGSSQERQIGVLAPLVRPFWLGASPVVRLELTSHRHVGPALHAATTPFMAAAEAGRFRHGLLVYDGGRA